MNVLQMFFPQREVYKKSTPYGGVISYRLKRGMQVRSISKKLQKENPFEMEEENESKEVNSIY